MILPLNPLLTGFIADLYISFSWRYYFFIFEILYIINFAKLS